MIFQLINEDTDTKIVTVYNCIYFFVTKTLCVEMNKLTEEVEKYFFEKMLEKLVKEEEEEVIYFDNNKLGKHNLFHHKR